MQDNLPPGAAEHAEAPFNTVEMVKCPDCNGSGEDCYMCSDSGEITAFEYEDIMFSINDEKDL